MIYGDYYYYKIDIIFIKLYEINQAKINRKIIVRIKNSNKIIIYIAKIHI